MESTSALLSNPKPAISLGSSSAPLTFRAMRSSIALTYSARFSRCEATPPGLGEAAATRSSAVSSEVMKPFIAA